MMRRRRERRPDWVPTDEAFIVLRERDVQDVMSEGLDLGAGYKVALRDRAGAESHGKRMMEEGWVVLRVDLTDLADRIDPGAPMKRGEWISLPMGTGGHTFLIGHIPASALTGVAVEPDDPGLPGPM